MKQYRYYLIAIILGLILVSCGGGDTPPIEKKNIVGVVSNGKIYYRNNCGVCHSAGLDDINSTFLSSNLAQKHDKIKPDMRVYGGNNQLMDRFDAVSDQRIADLKAYLKTIYL